MLLAAIGLVAVVVGGESGTFATFNAQVSNNGNYFATGSLILNDNGGTNTCTSAIAASNSNSGTNCDTLFNVASLTFPSATSNQTVTSATTTIDVTGGAVANGPIYSGDTLKIGSDTMTATAYAATGATSISVSAGSLASDTFPSGTAITDENATYLAHLTLTNAGSLASSPVSFKTSAICASQYGHASGTLNGAVSSGVSTSSISVSGLSAGAFHSGDPVIVSDGTNAQTFIASGTSTSSAIPVHSQSWNFSYANGVTVSGPEFNGPTAANLCGSLTFSITQESAFSDDLTTAASCVYGSTTTPAYTNACDFNDSPPLSTDVTSFHTLTGTGLASGASEYFLLAVHYIGTSPSNVLQDTQTTPFGLTWHIDQA